MMQQKFPLGNETLVRKEGPETSTLAAIDLAGSADLGDKQRWVLQSIAKFPGLTMMENWLRQNLLPYSTFTARYSELARAGLIEKRGRRRNPSGKWADCWFVKENRNGTKGSQTDSIDEIDQYKLS